MKLPLVFVAPWYSCGNQHLYSDLRESVFTMKIQSNKSICVGFRLTISLLVAMAAATISSANRAAETGEDGRQLDFNRDIRPILSDHCYRCHGPDAGQRKADLRLDNLEGATDQLPTGGYAIVPGRVQQSQLIRRITSNDDDFRMPPPHVKKPLSTEQIQRLQQWISAGAHWQPHWSFIPPQRPSLPVVRRQEWPKNAIDYFILHRLEAEGISPSAGATQPRLLRRLTFDLTGLPPTSQQLDHFLSDPSPNAYEKLVDRLLASPRHGEHRARYWLDLARYADTHGLHLDNQRGIWRFRDWVIAALNSNLPFDQFTIHQLAGDLLPEPQLDELIATGFIRCNVTTGEGGTIAEEFRVRATVERVETMTTVWMGLTAGCASCHDHKFDPLTQKEFYQLYAFFNNLSDKGTDGNRLTPSPVVRAPLAYQTRRLQELQTKIDKLRQRLRGPMSEADVAMATWIGHWRRHLESPNISDDKPLPAVQLNPWHVIGPFQAANYEAAFRTIFPPESEIDLTNSYSQSELRWTTRPNFIDGKVHQLSGDYCATYLYRNLVSPTARRVTLSLGSDHGIIVWLNGHTLLSHIPQRTAAADQDQVDAYLRPRTNHLLLKIANFRGKHGVFFRLIDENKSGLPEQIRTILRTVDTDRSDSDLGLLREYFRRLHWPPLTSTITELDGLISQRFDLHRHIPNSMIARQRSKPRDTFVLIRGRYDQHGEKIEADVPAALPSLPVDSPRNRLALARWLVNPTHPLTARVTVNRFWQQYFGTGIVATSEDLGSQGKPPTHPAALDWLAVELKASSWDLKSIQRQIVCSATYRQSSKWRQELLQKDPDNRLLARGPRVRLDAEMIRDAALAISGLLVEEVGGPSVRPYQPSGIWKAVGFTESNTVEFVQDHGAALYRRSLYTFWKRTAPAPAMRAFDAPTREACIVRRSRSNTPLQALVLMNDKQFIEAARAFGERLMIEGGNSAEDRIKFAFRLATSRQPSPREVDIAVKTYQSQLDEFQRDPKEAHKLVNIGESKPRASLDFTELAAWTAVANMILNLDEVICH